MHINKFKKAGWEIKYLKNYAVTTTEDDLTSIYESCDAFTDIVVGAGKVSN